MKGQFDFAGWVTRNDVKCADGRTIRRDAFKHCDGMVVPLVYNHGHDSLEDVLGHVLLENRPEGVYGYVKTNDTENGKLAKELVHSGDIVSFSIYANNLTQSKSKDVTHGDIKEVSLVLAGANPEAYIETFFEHGIDGDEGMRFYMGEGDSDITEDVIQHSATKNSQKREGRDMAREELMHSDIEALMESFNDMSEEDQETCKAFVGLALADAGVDDVDDEDYDDDDYDEDEEYDEDDDDVEYEDDEDEDDDEYEDDEEYDEDFEDYEGGDDMKHNAFDMDDMEYYEDNVLEHSDMVAIIDAGKRGGSLKEAYNDYCLAHSIPMDGMVGPSQATINQDYAVRDMDMLFPEYKSLSVRPEFIKRDTAWADIVLAGVHKIPFKRVKSMYADITEDEARAKGYIKGTQKATEVFTLLKRTTDPQTIYKMQKLDRDDILDIEDFDVVAWIKGEMEIMFTEEKARAILIGDGRSAVDPYKIQEIHIRPIVTDVDLYNIKVPVNVPANADEAVKAKTFITSVLRARKKYKGSGNPILFTTEDVVTECLLLEDGIGHRLYKTIPELETALRVSRIVTVEVMEGKTVSINNADKELMGVIVNLNDYTVGGDGAKERGLFDDFDIDFNQYKYLIETRMSGALTKPFSAMTIYLNQAQAASGGSGTGTGTG